MLTGETRGEVYGAIRILLRVKCLGREQTVFQRLARKVFRPRQLYSRLHELMLFVVLWFTGIRKC